MQAGDKSSVKKKRNVLRGTDECFSGYPSNNSWYTLHIYYPYSKDRDTTIANNGGLK